MVFPFYLSRTHAEPVTGSLYRLARRLLQPTRLNLPILIMLCN